MCLYERERACLLALCACECIRGHLSPPLLTGLAPLLLNNNNNNNNHHHPTENEQELLRAPERKHGDEAAAATVHDIMNCARESDLAHVPRLVLAHTKGRLCDENVWGVWRDLSSHEVAVFLSAEVARVHELVGVRKRYLMLGGGVWGWMVVVWVSWVTRSSEWSERVVGKWENGCSSHSP